MLEDLASVVELSGKKNSHPRENKIVMAHILGKCLLD